MTAGAGFLRRYFPGQTSSAATARSTGRRWGSHWARDTPANQSTIRFSKRPVLPERSGQSLSDEADFPANFW